MIQTTCFHWKPNTLIHAFTEDFSIEIRLFFQGLWVDFSSLHSSSKQSKSLGLPRRRAANSTWGGSRSLNSCFQSQNAALMFKRSSQGPCLCLVKSSHLYLYSAFYNTDCFKAAFQCLHTDTYSPTLVLCRCFLVLSFFLSFFLSLFYHLKERIYSKQKPWSMTSYQNASICFVSQSNFGLFSWQLKKERCSLIIYLLQ